MGVMVLGAAPGFAASFAIAQVGAVARITAANTATHREFPKWRGEVSWVFCGMVFLLLSVVLGKMCSCVRHVMGYMKCDAQGCQLLGLDARHGAAAIRAIAACLGAVFQVGNLCTAVGAGVANFGTQRAELATKGRAA